MPCPAYVNCMLEKTAKRPTGDYAFFKIAAVNFRYQPQNLIPLSQNIELLHLYIEIEQSRQNNRFNYNIVVDKGLNPDITLVHGLVLQPW